MAIDKLRALVAKQQPRRRKLDTRGCGELNPRPFSVTPVREDLDFSVPKWIGKAVRMPTSYSGYCAPTANQGIEPRDFDLRTGIAPPIPLVRILLHCTALDWISK